MSRQRLVRVSILAAITFAGGSAWVPAVLGCVTVGLASAWTDWFA